MTPLEKLTLYIFKIGKAPITLVIKKDIITIGPFPLPPVKLNTNWSIYSRITNVKIISNKQPLVTLMS